METNTTANAKKAMTDTITKVIKNTDKRLNFRRRAIAEAANLYLMVSSGTG